MEKFDVIIHIVAFLVVAGALLWYGFVFVPAMFNLIDCTHDLPTCESTPVPGESEKRKDG